MGNELHVSRDFLYSDRYSDETIADFLGWLGSIGYVPADVAHCIIYPPVLGIRGAVLAYVYVRDHKTDQVKSFNGEVVTVARAREYRTPCPLLERMADDS